MIYNFLEFIVESDKFGLPYFFSKKLNDFLFTIIKNTSDKEVKDIVHHILEQESRKEISSNFTFLDISDKNDTISFLQSNRIHKIWKDLSIKDDFESWVKYEKIKDNSIIWKSNLRSEARIGKTFRKILSDGGKTFSDSIIERFVNLYKSNFDFQFNLNGRFELISGKNISPFYSESNYSSRFGQLGNSCMRYQFCQEFFKIYTENPEVCNLLVLYTSPQKDTISGRALIWNCTNGSTYLDRVYTNNDSDINLFYEYAKNKGWEKEWRDDRIVQLKKWKFEKYPYMDTFCVMDGDNGKIFSDPDLWVKKIKLEENFLQLKSTNGGYLDTSSVVWSKYSNTYLIKSECVYIDDRNDWVNLNDAIYLDYLGIYVHPEESVNWSEYHQDYILNGDCVRSELLDDYIFTESSVDVVKSNKKGKIEFDSIPNDCQDLMVDVVVFLETKKLFKKSIHSLIIKNPISGVNYLSGGDIILYELDDKTIGINSMDLDDAKILEIDTIGDPIWKNADSYIYEMSSIGKLSKDQVIDYIKKLDINTKDFYDDLISMPVQFSNFRKSPIYPLTKLNPSDLSELIKRCLINYDLSLKYNPNDVFRMNNPEIKMLLNEFLTRNEDLYKRVGLENIARLYQITNYMIPTLFKDTDVLLSWYNKIVFA